MAHHSKAPALGAAVDEAALAFSFGKRMNRDKAVTEANRDFIGRIGCMYNPVSRIIDGLLHFRDDPMGFDADIARGLTILPRPTPHVAEHPLVQFA